LRRESKKAKTIAVQATGGREPNAIAGARSGSEQREKKAYRKWPKPTKTREK